MNHEELNLVLNYARNFLGYGNLDAPYWFVGLEEAGVQNPGHTVVRANVWQGNPFERNQTVDLFDYSQQLGAVGEQMHGFVQNERLDPRRWFQLQRPPTQETWRPLIRFLLAIEHQLPAINHEALEVIRLFQRDNWGRDNSNTCLLELFGLPKAANGAWPYADIPRIATRELGVAETFNQRKQALQAVLHKGVANGSLRVVLFYGGGHIIERWSEVCGIHDWNVQLLLNSAFRWQKQGQVLFLGIAHPGRGRICCDQEAHYMRALAEWAGNILQ